MSIYEYGIGGNEVKVDANEAIADIPSNRTLLVQKLTKDAPITPEAVYGLKTIDEVFENFKPEVEVEFQDENGADVKESIAFKNLGDFGMKSIKENSDFLNMLNIEQNQNVKIAKQLTSNKALRKALEDPEARAAIVALIENSIKELDSIK
ncbi:MAG: hypothetical protein N4A45_13295 [Flavobacteriales bacterium]|jgi:hypothetical protein|nr:hypothetical protein [Flavobacteriales bacterium]